MYPVILWIHFVGLSIFLATPAAADPQQAYADAFESIELAAQRMAQEKPGQTLQATALVHEAYLRLVDVEKVQHWDSCGHFFACAAPHAFRFTTGTGRDRVSSPRRSALKPSCG